MLHLYLVGRMSTLNELIEQIENPDLRARIQMEVSRLNKQKKFGLVFEEHLPECTPLYEIPVKKGSTVALKAGKVNETYTVLCIDDGVATCERQDNHERIQFQIDELVCVAKFGEPIYPYLSPIDSVCNAPDSSLWHTLIEADNFHALQLLVYLYGGKVDCIYIDPPYNTGATDWKYNNDYVDSNDAYRHSKWLSMMQKRLRLAKQLLNPNDSVLIVTIDEKEYLHLGCLLEEVFPEANIQMVSSIISQKGAARTNEFSRVNEFIFFVMIGDYHLAALDDAAYAMEGESIHWQSFRRSSASNIRTSRPSQFYPIYVNKKTRKIEEIGDPIPHTMNRFSVKQRANCEAVFPVRDDGTEMLWGIVPEQCRARAAKGYIKAGNYQPHKPQQFTIQYLMSGTIDDINNGIIKVTGYAEDGSVLAENLETKKISPRSQWDKKTHDARDYGTKYLKNIFGDSRFNFPKSLYAVHDCIKYFTINKPNALIVDFFAGSGTTLHAVNLLNAEDGGSRRCILVTNNEVSYEEAKIFKEAGIKPGTTEWNARGIARYVTWPRTVCSIEGRDIKGKPLEGLYVDTDIKISSGFKANAAFFHLGFLDKNAVAVGRQFKELLPLLWMKAGAVGPCPKLAMNKPLPEYMILPENKFAVLIDENAFHPFAKELAKSSGIDVAYIVTDSERGYRQMISKLNIETTYQLYRDYLDNFRINKAR